MPEYIIARFAGRSFDDEFGSTIDSDLVLLQAAIIAIIIFTIAAISDCKDGCVGSRVALSAGGACLHLQQRDLIRHTQQEVPDGCACT